VCSQGEFDRSLIVHVVLKVALYVLMPLLWGLGVEFVFERLRRRRGKPAREETVGPYDWVI